MSVVCEEEAASISLAISKNRNPHYTSIILFLSTLLVATVLDFVRRFPVSEKSSTWTFPSCVSCVPSVWNFQHHIHTRAGDNSTFCQLLILLSELFSSIYLSIYLSRVYLHSCSKFVPFILGTPCPPFCSIFTLT